MSRLSLERLTTEWTSLIEAIPPQVAQMVRALATEHKAVLAGYFYSKMLADADASVFLSHDEVKNRLHRSMQNWLVSVFATDTSEGIQTAIAHQHKIGEVHARVGIPVHLVLRGARHLKERFHQILQQGCELPAEQLPVAVSHIYNTVDFAMEIMSHAYADSHERLSRAEEGYRLFAVTQNLAMEKERQRAALLDWENQMIFGQATGLSADQLPRIAASEFGLWFRHKGAHGFEGALETTLILEALTCIDDTLLPLFARSDAEQRISLLRDLRDQAKGIAYHLDLLFEQSNELESGRDVLTRLLNRKFLPVIMSKQINYALKSGTTFAVLALDLDYFKKVNDRYGHEAGDLVLQQFATLLLNKSRAGDYLFRLGGEEFLMLLVDVTPTNARFVAEKLRKQIAAEAFRLPGGERLNISSSMGLAMFNGHPDYQRLMRRADEALYKAKHDGRNQLVIASF